jgi:2-C-methyl-D-erythritol 4-phosphate cytidylyltransferase
VVAAGSGSRLGHAVPKALVEVAGRPLVRWAVDALAAGGVTGIVVVAPEAQLAEFEALLADAPVPVAVVAGGAERQDSVRLGLEAIGPAEVVLVHDAARPLVPPKVVADVIDAVRAGARAVVPVLPVVDSVRRQTPDGSRVVDRSELRAVQTPQGFEAGVLREAHRNAVECALAVTDDASACEALGEDITFVPGDRAAMKITEPFDLLVAEAIVETRR